MLLNVSKKCNFKDSKPSKKIVLKYNLIKPIWFLELLLLINSLILRWLFPMLFSSNLNYMIEYDIIERVKSDNSDRINQNFLYGDTENTNASVGTKFDNYAINSTHWRVSDCIFGFFILNPLFLCSASLQCALCLYVDL